MSQVSNIEIPDNESLEIVKNYLKQISNEPITENNNELNTSIDTEEIIINNIKSYLTTECDTESSNNNSNEINCCLDETDNLNETINCCLDETDNLNEKIQLQKILENKINETIEKEKELLRITQEKLICEVKLLDVIKQRLLEEEKYNNLVMTPKVATCENTEVTEVINQNLPSPTPTQNSETKVTKINSTMFKYYKR